MPYGKGKIKYGEAPEGFSPEENKAYVQDMEKALELSRCPVGVKLLFTKEAFDAYPCEEMKGKSTYCIMLKQGSKGVMAKSVLSNHTCDGATIALGMEKAGAEIEDGSTYYSYNLFNSPAAARRMFSNIVSLHRNPAVTYGVVTGPLEDFTEMPDVVIVYSNPEQAMKLVEGFTYFEGRPPKIRYGAMQAFCSELTAYPYLTGEMNISLFCPSTRMLGKWGCDEMAVGIPFDRFYHVLDGMFSIEGKAEDYDYDSMIATEE